MANLTRVSPLVVNIGDTIKFTVKDINDNTIYIGKVVSICDYEAARMFSDVATTQQAMLAADATIDDVTVLRYHIVECQDGIRRPFGFSPDGSTSWYTENKLEITEIGNEYKIRLFNASSDDAVLAIKVLREQGISCRLLIEE